MTMHARDVERQDSPKVHITVVVANRYAFDTDAATGREIKAKAGIPAAFDLYRRGRGGNDSIGDDDAVELHDGDHLFARPPRTPGTHEVEE